MRPYPPINFTFPSLSRRIAFAFALGMVGLLFQFCGGDLKESEANSSPISLGSTYASLIDSTRYVGMLTCKGCHADIYQSYTQNGMGQSLDTASPQKSAGVFGREAHVFDKAKNLHYKPFFKGKQMYLLEYRLEGKDTVYQRLEAISSIVGSGHHTNSHFTTTNGYVHQAPITFYTQAGRWDLPPGFSDGANTRFSRPIENECMTCHNALPTPVPAADNKYLTVPQGIDCERCHGPGSTHVAEKSKGVLVDIKKKTDYSIVNPRKLSLDLQVSLCQRCHLQGTTVLNEGKTFYDFRPGQDLKSHMQVFLPRFTDSKDRFIMASHADRMVRSECFRVSAKLTCITCHNPHLPVHTVPEKHYADACRGCHTPQNFPTHPAVKGKTITMGTSNCIPCHMPKSGTTDIPHVTVTDHFIRKAPNVSKDYAKATGDFLGLACINNPNADALTRARAYLQYFDRVEARAVCLDSAAMHLSAAANSQLKGEAYVYLYFLRREPTKVLTAFQQLPNSTQDGWTAYRAGESALALNRVGEAVVMLQQACQLKPFQLDFRLKLGAALLSKGDATAAEREFAYVVKENPKNARGHLNLGYCKALSGDFTTAERHYRTTLALDPDLTQALVNLGGLLGQKGDKTQAITLLKRAQKLDPKNAQVKAMLAQL